MNHYFRCNLTEPVLTITGIRFVSTLISSVTIPDGGSFVRRSLPTKCCSVLPSFSIRGISSTIRIDDESESGPVIFVSISSRRAPQTNHIQPDESRSVCFQMFSGALASLEFGNTSLIQDYRPSEDTVTGPYAAESKVKNEQRKLLQLERYLHQNTKEIFRNYIN